MPRPSRLLALAAAICAALASGCVADLGPCDEAAARRLVFTDDLEGAPAYEGQALVVASCGNGSFCHAEVAPAQRFGVPHGLGFDLRLASSEEGLERLRRAHATVVDRAGHIYDAVLDERMPPDGAGEAVVERGRAYRGLPAIESAEGRAILRNWLACGAPVVERVADDRPAGVAPVGDVVAASPGVVNGCPGGDLCGAQCASIGDDAARCGDCGTPCSVGGLCVDGACSACAAGLVLCGSRCVDTGADADHCGGCDAPCADGEVCSGGSCAAASCPGGTTECEGACVDTETSVFHCGGCGAACAPGESCATGSCDCGDTSTDPFDCGACGHVCPLGADCVAGDCACAPPLLACGGRCVDTDTDEAHCGGCGAPCGGTDRCVDGLCQPCGTGISFASDVLGLFDGACVGSLCHGGASPAAGLPLGVDRAYDAIVNVPSREEPEHLLVDPFDPAESHLLERVLAEGDAAHARMPLGAAALGPEDVEVLRAWICMGAPEN